MPSKPGIIDYGGGNLQSVRNAVRALGHEPVIVQSEAGLDQASALIFPGQGAFGDCMAALHERGLVGPLREWIQKDRPFLGICIGYQALFSGGQENPGVEGLNVFPGRVVRFPSAPGLKIPHMGWNQADLTDAGNPAWDGLGAAPFFYYVHSYYPEPDDPSLIAATTEYGNMRFAAAIQRGRLTATQFHPEKSQALGLRLIANFLAWKP